MFKPPRLLYFIKADLKCNTNCKSLSVWSWDFQGWSCNLCWRKFCLCFLLAVLWYHVFCLTLGAMLSLFLCMVWRCDLTSLIYMRLSSFLNTTCWRTCLFSILVNMFSKEVLLIKVCTFLDIIHCILSRLQFGVNNFYRHWETKKICVTCFIDVFASLQ